MKRWLWLLIFCCSCSSPEEEPKAPKIIRVEPVVRKADQRQFALSKNTSKKQLKLPWQSSSSHHHPITKEHFRCKGSFANPVRTTNEKNGARYFDCGGVDRHSLFLQDGKEFIYPILLDLLNFVQDKTGKKVIVTSGYRCPDHNTYVDSSPSNAASKHMVGAAVDFYVQGLEVDKVASILMGYYKNQAKEFSTFERATKSDVSTLPWMTKEITIKICKSTEGRDVDTCHNLAYICLQVRYDKERDKKVVCNWDDAFKGYLRK